MLFSSYKVLFQLLYDVLNFVRDLDNQPPLKAVIVLYQSTV